MRFRNNLVNSKKVYQLDENENIIKEFPSMAEASRELGTNHTSIYACLNGKQKHAFGYKWKYADEELQKWNKCGIIKSIGKNGYILPCIRKEKSFLFLCENILTLSK